MKRLTKNGMTLIEALLTLLVTSIVCMIGVVYLHVCMNVVEIEPFQQNQFAILQLRTMCALSSSRKVEEERLYIVYRNKEYTLYYDRNRLVQTEGYEIWMEGITSCEFKEENNEIYCIWTFHEQEYTSQIY